MWVYPTYGRPERCQAVCQAMRKFGAEAAILVYTSEDDPAISDYRSLILPEGCELIVMPEGQGWFTDKVNAAFNGRPNEPWYGVVYDDLEIMTEFEGQLRGAAGRFGIASANDLWQAREDVKVGRIHGAAVFGGDLLRALGYWLPSGLKHLYIDDVWEMIGRVLGNWRTLMHVITKHNHPMINRAAMDATYERGNSPERYREDKAAFTEWCGAEASAAILRASNAIDTARVEILRRAQERSLLICIFTYERPVPECAAALAETRALLTKFDIKHRMHECRGMSLLPIGRNYAAKALLESDCTDLLMIDDDMQWQAWDVIKLLASPQDIIGAVGKRKDLRSETDLTAWCFSFADDFDGNIHVDEFGAVEIARIGTAFLRIHRRVFETIKDERPDLWRRHITAGGEEKGGYVKAFAITDVENIEAGEDYSFCNLWRDLGGKIHLDPTIRLIHWGRYAYSGEVSSIFNLDAEEFSRLSV